MLQEAPLGKTTTYVDEYAPNLLFQVPRKFARDKSNINEAKLPFQGIDIWNGVELSWLNPKGKPQVATIELRFPCTSPYIVESKSLKLYLNSFSQSRFESVEKVRQTIANDLRTIIGAPFDIKISLLNELDNIQIGKMNGECLDNLDVHINAYSVTPEFLQIREGDVIEETLYSDLLKSNCLATGQPDWGSIEIHYRGKPIDHVGLLKYIVSYRQHVGFGEHCIEQIFTDILQRCQPELLSVYGRYTKRGGLDICPFRSNYEQTPSNTRLVRQ
jgi:7-cyano-7-deazaguanine reductase